MVSPLNNKSCPSKSGSFDAADKGNSSAVKWKFREGGNQTIKTYNQLSGTPGKTILKGQYNSKTEQTWPYPMNSGDKGVLPCYEFNKGYTGNIEATCNNRELIVDLSKCRQFNGCDYGASRKNKFKDKVACYSGSGKVSNNKDAADCYFKRAGQYRCFCPPNYYGDGIETGSGCKKCPPNSSNKGIDINVWRNAKSRDEWLQTGPGQKHFPNADMSSCICDPGYESKLERWNNQGKQGPKPSAIEAYKCISKVCPTNSQDSKRKPPVNCDCKPGFTNQSHEFRNSKWNLNVSGTYKSKTYGTIRLVHVGNNIAIYDQKNKLLNNHKKSFWDNTNEHIHIEWNPQKKSKYKVTIDVKNPSGLIKTLQGIGANKDVFEYIIGSNHTHSHNMNHPAKPYINKCVPASCLLSKDVFKNRNIDITKTNANCKNFIKVNQTWSVLPNGDTCQPKCNPGYSLNNVNPISCSNGKLSNIPTCIPNKCQCGPSQKPVGVVGPQKFCMSDKQFLCSSCKSPHIMFQKDPISNTGKCHKVTDCQPGEKISKPVNVNLPFNKGGDQICAKCGSNEYTSKINESVCNPHSPCDKGKEAKKPLSTTKDVTCVPCQIGHYKPNKSTQDCKKRPPCKITEFKDKELEKKDFISTNICKPRGEVQITNPDIQWKLIPLPKTTNSNVRDLSGFKLIRPDLQKFTNQAVSCGSGYHLIYKSDFDTISNKGTIPKRDPKNCNDKLCICAANICKKSQTCKFGPKKYNAPNVNDRCLHHNVLSCRSCTRIQHWDVKNKVCSPNICSCDNGTPMSPNQCIKNRKVIRLSPLKTDPTEDYCKSCNPGYKLINNQCVPFAGTCKNGIINPNISLRTRDNQCHKCNIGYELSGTAPNQVCTEAKCKTVVPPNNGKIGTCVNPMDHGKTCQQSCNDGFEPDSNGNTASCDKGKFKPINCIEKSCPKGTVAIQKPGNNFPVKNALKATKDMKHNETTSYQCQDWSQNYRGVIPSVKCSRGKLSIINPTKNHYDSCKPYQPCGDTQNDDCSKKIPPVNSGKCVNTIAGNYKCVCPKNTYMNNKRCQPCPNNTRTKGDGKTSVTECNQCDPGKHLSNGRCIPNQCTCKNGTPGTGVSCPVHNKEHCIACNPKTHTLDKKLNICKEKGCPVDTTKDWWGDNSTLKNATSICNVVSNVMKPNSSPNPCKPKCNAGYTISGNKEVTCKGGTLLPIKCNANKCQMSPNCLNPVKLGHVKCITGNEKLCGQCKPGYRLIRKDKLDNVRQILNISPGTNLDYTDPKIVKEVISIPDASKSDINNEICVCIPNICQCKDKNGKIVGPPTLNCQINNIDVCKQCYNCTGKLLPNNKFCGSSLTQQSCNQTLCDYKLRYLDGKQCKEAPKCQKGERYDRKTYKCMPCPSGTYQDKVNHRDEQCKQQEMCAPQSLACRQAWTDPGKPLIATNTESCYVQNPTNMDKQQKNKCLRNSLKRITQCTTKVGSKLKDHCIECNKGTHLRKSSDGTITDKAYCTNKMCKCQINICTCKKKGNYATSGVSCPKHGTESCKGCPVGQHAKSKCQPGTVPVYDANKNIVCTSRPGQNRIQDCTQNVCNCKSFIEQKDLPNISPKGWTLINKTFTKDFPQGVATGAKCTTNGATICTICPTGFKLENNKCVPKFKGKCLNGQMFPIVDSNGIVIRNRNDHCQSCNNGFRLVFASEVNLPNAPTRTQTECRGNLCKCIPISCPISPLSFKNASLGNCNLQNTQNVTSITDKTTNKTTISLLHSKTCKPVCNPGYHSKNNSGVSCNSGKLTPQNLCSLNKCVCPNGTPSSVCPKHKSEHCSDCGTGYFLKNNKCVPHTKCSNSQYEIKAPTNKSDRICVNIRTCNSKQYQSKAPTTTSNRVCSSYPVCPPGQYLDGYTATKPGKCVRCPGKTFNTSSGAMSKSQCFIKAACKPGEYIKYYFNNNLIQSDQVAKKIQTLQATGSSLNQIKAAITTKCSPLTNCVTGETEKKPFVPYDGTSEKNRICIKLDTIKKCKPGEKTIDNKLPFNRGFDRNCQPCNNGEYSTNGIACLPHPLCKKGQETSRTSIINNKLTKLKKKTCVTCSKGSYSPKDETDYVNFNKCLPQPPACLPGQKTETITGKPWKSINHGITHKKVCKDCPPGEFSNKIDSPQCQKIKDCKPNEYEVTKPTVVQNRTTSDRVCRISQDCVGGKLISQKDPSGKYIRTMDRQCGVCNTGYHLRLASNASRDNTLETPAKVKQCEGNLCLCLPNKCMCGPDTPPSSPPRRPKISPNANGTGWNNVPLNQQCLVHNPVKQDIHNSTCIGCETGFYLDKKANNNRGICKPNKCTCPIPGSISASNLTTEDRDKYLAECKTNKNSSDCRINQPLKTTQIYALNHIQGRAQCLKDNQQSCAQCPAGYHLKIVNDIGNCIPFSTDCREYSKQGKLSLVKNLGFLQKDTIMDQQCSKCKPGYRLVLEDDYNKNKNNLSGIKEITNKSLCKQKRCICIQNNCECKSTNIPRVDIGTATSTCKPQTTLPFTQSCQTCNPGYTQQNKNCIPNQCVCKDGNKVVGLAPPAGDPRCLQNNDPFCVKCTHPNYKHVNNRCTTYGGTCANGTIQVVNKRTQENECISCNPGYTLDKNKKQCIKNTCLCPNGVPAGKKRVSPTSNQLVDDPSTQPLCNKNNSVVCNTKEKCNSGYDLLNDFDRTQIKLHKFIQKPNKVCQKQCVANQFVDDSGLRIRLHSAQQGLPNTYVKRICDTNMKSQDTCRGSNNEIKPPLCHNNYQLTGGASEYDRGKQLHPTHYQPRCYDGKVYYFEKSCVPRPRSKGTAAQQR